MTCRLLDSVEFAVVVQIVYFDAVLNFREAYMEYIPNYPIAAYRIDEEIANNQLFKQFVNVSKTSKLYAMS